MTYREARSLKQLHAEINATAPERSIATDGWIGDADHATRDSDHNPWVEDADGIGVVRARDFTHDPDGGLDCDMLADYLAGQLGKHPALGPGAYLIWEARIISTDRLEDGWRPYPGTNAHRSHLHVSVATRAAGYDSNAPWGWKETMDKILAVLKRIDGKVDALTADLAEARKALGLRVSAEADNVVDEIKGDGK